MVKQKVESLFGYLYRVTQKSPVQGCADCTGLEMCCDPMNLCDKKVPRKEIVVGATLAGQLFVLRRVEVVSSDRGAVMKLNIAIMWAKYVRVFRALY